MEQEKPKSQQKHPTWAYIIFFAILIGLFIFSSQGKFTLSPLGFEWKKGNGKSEEDTITAYIPDIPNANPVPKPLNPAQKSTQQEAYSSSSRKGDNNKNTSAKYIAEGDGSVVVGENAKVDKIETKVITNPRPQLTDSHQKNLLRSAENFFSTKRLSKSTCIDVFIPGGSTSPDEGFLLEDVKKLLKAEGYNVPGKNIIFHGVNGGGYPEDFNFEFKGFPGCVELSVWIYEYHH